MQFLTPEDLEWKDINGCTALCFAVQLGIVIIAKEMVKKSANLPLIYSSEGRTPLHIAALLGRRDMVSYLFSGTPLKGLALDEHMEILVATITYDMYGMVYISIINKKNSQILIGVKPFINNQMYLSLHQNVFSLTKLIITKRPVFHCLGL